LETLSVDPCAPFVSCPPDAEESPPPPPSCSELAPLEFGDDLRRSISAFCNLFPLVKIDVINPNMSELALVEPGTNFHFRLSTSTDSFI